MSSIVQHEKTTTTFVANKISQSEAPCDVRGEAVDYARASKRARGERSLFLAALMDRGAVRLGACIRAMAQSKRPPLQTAPSKGTNAAITGLIYHILPMAAFALFLGATSVGHADSEDVASDATLTTIVRWLSTNFELPAIYEHPQVKLVTSSTLAALRYRGLVTSCQQSPVAGSLLEAQGDDLVAVYDDASRTIYLRQGWTADKPAQVSVLVHEMVHHLQNIAALKYNCPEAREEPAYAAQDRWLGRFGLSLESEFGIDPMSRLVKTKCLG
jgi:hypothetical protein